MYWFNPFQIQPINYNNILSWRISSSNKPISSTNKRISATNKRILEINKRISVKRTNEAYLAELYLERRGWTNERMQERSCTLRSCTQTNAGRSWGSWRGEVERGENEVEFRVKLRYEERIMRRRRMKDKRSWRTTNVERPNRTGRTIGNLNHAKKKNWRLKMNRGNQKPKAETGRSVLKNIFKGHPKKIGSSKAIEIGWFLNNQLFFKKLECLHRLNWVHSVFWSFVWTRPSMVVHGRTDNPVRFG